MNLKIEVKIKMDNGKEIILNSDDARELFYKLKELYWNEYKSAGSWPVLNPDYYRIWYPDYYRIWNSTNNSTQIIYQQE